jgi:hypothetical protein
VRHVARVVWQVETGTDADFEHAALGCRDDTAAIGSEISLLHIVVKVCSGRRDVLANPISSGNRKDRT